MAYIFPIERPGQRLIIATSIIFSLLPTVAVSLRLLARRRSHRKLDSSDYLIIAACIIAVTYQGVVIAAVLVGGLGFHTTEVFEMGGSDSFVLLMKLVIVVQVLWSLSLGLTKGSILVLYAKVFSLRPFILAAKVTAVLILLWALVLIVGAFLICQPLEFNWNINVPGGHCGNTKLLWYITGVFNIVTDMIVLLLPMPYLYGLELARYKKLALMGTFGIGLLVCIVSAVRLATLVNIDLPDFSFSGAIAVMFSALEPCLLITAACVPLLRPLLGGRYSKNGTAQSDPTTSAKSQRGGAGFNQLQDDSSVRRLRPEDLQYDAAVASPREGRSSGGVGEQGTDHNMELGFISVKKDWRIVEEHSAGKRDER